MVFSTLAIDTDGNSVDGFLRFVPVGLLVFEYHARYLDFLLCIGHTHV